MKQLHLKTLRIFLPLLFILYLAGIMLFTHSHVVNGVTIVHSHPFDKDAHHTHTTSQLQLIHLLNHFIAGEMGLFPLLPAIFLAVICVLFVGARPIHLPKSPHHVISLRAPPAHC